MYRLVSVKSRLNLTKLTKIENGINRYLTDTQPILPIMLVSKMYRLVSVKYRLKMTKVEIWVNRYLTDITDTNRYLTDI